MKYVKKYGKNALKIREHQIFQAHTTHHRNLTKF